MPSLNWEFSNKGSTSLKYFSTGQSYLFTLHLEYSIIHFNSTIIFTSTSQLCGRFALKRIRPRLLRPHLLKSIRPMTNNTLQHRLLKMLFAWIILLPLLNKQVKRSARSQKCRRFATSILNIFCIKSSLQNVTICRHFHFDAYSFTNQRRANPKVIYLGSLMLMPQQQHYTCHILRSLSTNPNQAFLIRISHSCLTVFADFRTATED